MEEIFYLDSKVIGDTVDVTSSRLAQWKGEDMKNSDKEPLSEKRIGKEKKYGHLRIHSDGQVSYKKINSTVIIESIQLGIDDTVGGLANCPERDVLMKDFMTVQSKAYSVAKHLHPPLPRSLWKSSSFTFKTYAPIAFRYFRDLFGIKPEDFVSSFCDDSLVELPNPGTSVSLIYLTHDDKFIIKTVQHKEATFLQKLLPGYYLNLNQNPLTLLPKFFGLYCFQRDSKDVRLVAINNVLPTSVKIHQKYGLKGSTFKRKASVKEVQKGFPTFKDLDFIEHHPEGIFLENSVYKNLIRTIERDCTVLESFRIIDYSLLVGIHNLDQAKKENVSILKKDDKLNKDEMKSLPFGDGATCSAPFENIDAQNFKTKMHQTNNTCENSPILIKHTNCKEKVTEGTLDRSGLPARNSKGENVLLYIGIIDILQSYRFKKRLEHVWKSICHNGDEVSVHNPAFYSRRFQDFMSHNVFKTLHSSPKSGKKKNVSK